MYQIGHGKLCSVQQKQQLMWAVQQEHAVC